MMQVFFFLLHQLSIIKKLDLCGNEARITLGVFIRKLWGVETSTNVTSISQKDDTSLYFMVGEMWAMSRAKILYFGLKAFITVVSSFSNSPITKMGVNSKNISFPLVVKNIEVLLANRVSFFNVQSRGINMINPNKSQLHDLLIDAARNADIITMKRLIKQGADPFEINWSGQSALTIIADQDIKHGVKIIEELATLIKGV